MIAHPIAPLIGYPIRFYRVYPNRPRIARIGSCHVGPKYEPCSSHSRFSSARAARDHEPTSPMRTAATGGGL